MTNNQPKKKRICIIGAGAAGCSCAWLLNKHPDKFDVSLWEKSSHPGGVATSVKINDEGLFINDGVQGGAPSYRNTLLLHKLNGFEPTSVYMKVSFGKNQTAWNNSGIETELVRRLRPEIKRFGKVLKWVKRFEFIFIFVPISRLLKITRFSEEFRNFMVFPLTALFFGTGNQTPSVSSAIIARVFLDPDLKLFDYDPDFLLSQQPEMFAFPNLESIYSTIIKNSENVKTHFNRGVERIERNSQGIKLYDANKTMEEFDEIVFACDAETALKLLGKEQATFTERKVLGNVKYYNDITVTHEDFNYMDKYYDMNSERNDQYFVRIDPQDNEKIDMSFNLSNYQPQLTENKNRHIFQTIFLDDTRAHLWSKDEIDKSKIILEKWWHQFAHTWKHFAYTVPFVRFIQNTKKTWYCGAYTLFNTHEIAVMSGLAVAVRLGAEYPFYDDSFATKQFKQYLKYSHGYKL